MKVHLLNKILEAYEKASYFLGLIKQELEVCSSFLNKAELTSFSKYYGFLINVGKRRLNHFKNSYAQRVQHLISSAQPGAKVLDAGCGFGSESILAGILEACVTGVDLSEERLNVANKRLRFYEDKAGKSLNIRFHAKSVFNVTDVFDVIWAQDSISHIEPVEKFIRFTKNHLSEDGRLIMADANAFNPYIYLRAWNYQRKKGGIYKTVRNPKNGEAVVYAQERVLSLPLIREILVRNGFDVKCTRISDFCPYIPLFNLGQRPFSYYVEETLSRGPLTKLLGATYVIIAVKNLQGTQNLL